jgi:HEAT repeat protein
VSLISLLLKAADDADQQTRLAAVKTLGQLGGAAEVPPLLDRLLKAKEPQDRDALEKALSAVGARDEDSDARARDAIERLA